MQRLALLAVVALSLGCACLASPATDQAFVQFQAFVTKFNKQYATLQEFQQRFEVFQETLVRIQKAREAHFNATGESGDEVYGVTKFADLTAAEFKQRYLGFRPSASRPAQIPVVHPTATAIPTKFDWRSKGAISPVKDQADCGSCWAFSATEEIESMHFLEHGKLQTLSVQQIVSCDSVDQGCNGGDTITAYQYVEQAGGLETDSEYPYTSGGGDSGTCEDQPSDQVIGVSNYTYATKPCTGNCDNQDENTLARNLATKGPVSICVYAEPWQLYIGGILSTGCPHAYSDLDHCVQLTGYDQTGSVPYWIIRNSWNTDWGISGYIYVKIGGNVCGVADEATFVSTTNV